MSTSIIPIIFTKLPRWLEKIKWAFQVDNNGQDSQDADPSTFIRAINMALERSAATYVDSSENLCGRLIRGWLHRPIWLPIFQRFLTDRYYPTVVDPQPDYYPSVELYQEYDEPLAA
ncbi:hypothetical protein E4U40_004910 [Claviceps sp. LM458 group G5]|nr:hypothetical protein E4U40_004910 [Claviceps sp. LM458 group G5]